MVVAIIALLSCVSCGHTLCIVQTRAQADEVMTVARRAAAEAGYSITSIDQAKGWLVGQQSVSSGLFVRDSWERRIDIFVRMVGGLVEVEVVTPQDRVGGKNVLKALRRMLPDIKVITTR